MEKVDSLKVKHSPDDADYNIALSACTIALTESVVVVAPSLITHDITDLLPLSNH